jgi:peptidoglycan/xylan/chitin deacetylase (PgdA/CDA1 family)
VATFFIGYDVEHSDPNVTRPFLNTARALHEDLGVPCTFFIVGQTLRQNSDEFRELLGHPLIDLQQHTETHLRLKTVYQENEEGVSVFPGGSNEEVRSDVGACQRTFEEILGFRPTGLTGPYNYWRGLLDRPDLVRIVYDEGTRFLRCFGRNERDWQPTPFFGPFPLTALGFPDVWEYGIHGWQDCILRGKLGYSDHDGYFERFRADVDRVVAADGCFSYCQHDWSSRWDDLEMALTRRLLMYVRDAGMNVVNYGTHYAASIAGRKEPIPV